jgi:RNA recognition motif-containing protein
MPFTVIFHFSFLLLNYEQVDGQVCFPNSYICGMAKLFTVGIPKDMQEIELVEMFSVYGTVNTVTIVTDQQTGESKGYGFITMTDDAGAQRAIDALNGASIDDRIVSVRFADDKNPKPVSLPKPKRPRRT